MTVSKPPVPSRRAARWLLSVIVLACSLAQPLFAQDSTRYVRLFLRDKGTPHRALAPNDPLYAAASAHLTPRALTRRAKVLPSSRLVTTEDLPLYQPYLTAIAATGATIEQTSRWLNTVMVLADSMTIEQLRRLPFLDSLDVVRTHPGRDADRLAKLSDLERLTRPMVTGTAAQDAVCFAEQYGLADFQNRFMGIDEAHRMGFAGEGVLVGVIDAGFDWRNHRAFAATRILDEYDFIHDNANTANEREDSLANGSQEDHGTAVLSLIGATWRDTLVGGAPAASFMLAKTEDLQFERNVEEDNFVAGLEWLESRGVDITNTSLGYTGFTHGESGHAYGDLTGHTVPASRAVNHAVELGVVCILAAGNEGAPGRYGFVGVPAEADSAIAAAAVDSLGRVARFSSRGMSNHPPQKPDLAAFGVGNWAAHPSRPDALFKSQGTSFASPMTTAVAAVVLSAAPDLRPWELRALLERSATRSSSLPDTAIGFGVVNAGAALRELARTRTIVGTPAISVTPRCISLAAYTMRLTDDDARSRLDSHILVRLRVGQAAAIETRSAQPLDGLSRWSIASDEIASLDDGDAIVIDFVDARSGAVLRRDSLVVDDGAIIPSSTICATSSLAVENSGERVEVYPNPFREFARISFDLERDATVSLTIYNSIGEELIRLFDGAVLEAGCHTPLFDARGLPNGAYYVRLRIDDQTRTGEMIFIP